MSQGRSTTPQRGAAVGNDTQVEQARLEDAMRRADELLVSSLHGDERRRHKKRLLLFIGGSLMFGTVCTAVVLVTTQGAAGNAQAEQAAQLSAEGWQLWQKQDLGAAVVRFEQATKLDPRNSNAWNGLGWASFNSGNRERARSAFQEAIKIEPKLPAALNGLGQLALVERKYDDAEKYLEQAAPNAPAAWYGLARLYLLEGKYDQAARWAKKVVDSGEADQTAAEMLKAARAKNLPDDLRRTIEPPAAGTTANTANQVAQAWQLINQGRRDEAKTILNGILAKAPKDAAALNGMGWLLFFGGNSDEAKPYFERTLAVDPTAGGAMNGLARVLKAQGDDAGAIKIWQDMVEKLPGPHAGTAGLADVYLEQEKFQKALPLLEQLAKANPNDESLQKKLAGAKAGAAK
jgi:tetratricopeptide (TPR) repeat protein